MAQRLHSRLQEEGIHMGVNLPKWAHKSWQTLSAIKTGVILLIVVVIASAVGTVVLQRPATDPEELQRAYSPQTLRIFDALGLTDVYHAWWFVLLLVLVSLCIVAASIDRLPNAWRYYARPYKTPDESFRRALPLQKQIPVDDEESGLQAAERVFHELGYYPEHVAGRGRRSLFAERNRMSEMAVYVVHASLLLIFLGGIISPPSLMDDVDAVQAQIARNMLQSGDWVTARLDGVPYLEKAPLIYWAIALSYKVFGVRDWAARIPIALAAVALCWLTSAMGIWAFGKRAGFYAGLILATCAGLFLFTRILIPDVMITLTVALAMWGFLRALDEEEPHPRFWAAVLAVNLGLGLLLKSLIGIVFPIAAGLIYLYATRQLFSGTAWKRLHPFSGALIVLAVAAPWHVLATLRNPPYFALSLHSGPGQYHGFLWFFFINEQLLRFLNLRYPRDYDTVPRLYFWLFHLLWLFPWSVYLPAIAKLSFKPVDRAGRTRLLALCWAGFILVFFTFSTTQEYYSMPAYPALALLLGSAMATDGKWIRRGTAVLSVVAAGAAVAAIVILILSRGFPLNGDIFSALTQHPKAYKLSLGHMEDLTLASFAYLRFPLGLAALAFCLGALGTFKASTQRAVFGATLMMILFLHAARVAMVAFDPYLSSRPLAEALEKSPPGTLVINRHYYTFSSVFFYTNRSALLLNGRFMNLEYGAYAPGVPNVFIDDSQFKSLWLEPERAYIVAKESDVPRLAGLVGQEQLYVVANSGGKSLLTNHPLSVPAAGSKTHLS
jgi:4-amino-4-deoxy-L-arabinose transferase-like glycosyltransferase